MCLYSNVNSLKNKIDEFECVVTEEEPDIIGLTETWMKEAYSIKGYHPVIRHDRDRDQKGGGVMLFIHENLQVTECMELNGAGFEESVWCIIHLSSTEKLLVGVCYRSPNSSKENNEELNLLLNCTQRIQAKNVLIMGDFNYPHIQWEDGYVEGPENSDSSRFFDVTQSLFLYQHVSCDTRFRDGCSPSRLDLIFTNREYLVDGMQCRQPIGKSDHAVLTWKCVYQQKQEKRIESNTTTHYNFRRGRYGEMNDELNKLDWKVLEGMKVQAAWDFIKEKLYSAIRCFVPKAKKKRKKGMMTPWWSKGLKQEVKKKHKTWKIYLRTRGSEEHMAYTRQRNLTTQKIRRARRQYEAVLTDQIKSNPQKLYRYIRSRLKVKTMVGPLETSSGQVTQSDKEAAEVLNSFFESVFVKEDPTSMPLFPSRKCDSGALTDIDISKQDVLNELRKLEDGKASGPDGLPSTVFKSCAEALAWPLTVLFRKSINTGEIPQQWKQAIITPIFKKGSKVKPGNYRPVSLTSQCCKILERIIRKHIIDHLESNDFISPHQHGFVKNRSCQTNLLESLEDWTRMLDEGAGVDIVYLDYQKAFDTVPHERLKTKLQGYHITGKVMGWICEFLNNRTQRVSVNNSLSECTKITSGVPQGSVLGPILFIIYVNELPSLVKSKMKMYADDTKLYRPVSDLSDVQLLQDDLDVLTEWSKKWLLKFNVAKCKIMHCGKQNPRAAYYMKRPNGETKALEETHVEKDLGVQMSNTLKPTLQCTKAANKAMSALKLLRMTFGHFTRSNFKVLYATYVRPHLEHCIQATGPYMAQDFKALERVQRRATKQVQGLRHASYEERLKALDLTSVEERIRRGDLIETFKIVTGQLNVNASQFFDMNQDNRRGHPLKLKIRRVKTKARLKFFSNRVTSTWNKLPQDVVLARNTNEFKNRLDEFWKISES